MSSPTTELIKSKLDIVEFLRGYMTLTAAGRNFKGLCPFHHEKTPSFMVSPERQSWHCFGCFPPGQKVKTPFGYHNIEDVDANHFVISGKGEIRKVLRALHRDYQGDLVDVSVRKLGGIVSMTVDHQLPVFRPKTLYRKKTKQFYRRCREFVEKTGKDFSAAAEQHGEMKEVPAGELRVGDFVLYPFQTRITDVSKIDLREYLSKVSRLGPRPPAIPYIQKTSKNFLKLLGYYIAEGSNHRAYIRFSLGNHEEDFAAEIVSLIKKLFGLTAKIYRRPQSAGKTGLEITICHSSLANLFGNLCGKGAENKHIPFILQELSSAKQKVLIEAIWKGDGTSYIANQSTKEHREITTVSRVLAEQMVDIILRNGYFPSLFIAKEKIDKKGVHHKEAYTVRWSEEAKSQHSLVYTDKGGAMFWLLPVKSIVRKPYRGPVYNLTVDEDHSYVASNFAVSNCGIGGDVFAFLMRYENLDFSEALRVLAEKAGVELRHENPAEYKYSGLLYDLNNTAKDFYKKMLAASPVAQKYIESRGLTKETVERFEIGWVPNEPEALSMYLLNLGTSPQDLLQAGLAVKTERGLMLDRFRGRIMFPIHNHMGRVVGFTGRILPQFDQRSASGFVPGKYMNSPETPIFQKSKLVYGFWKSKDAVREEKSAVLVEGQMDFLMSYQSGVKNVIASSGTALTPDHLRALHRMAETLIINFDSDSAGSDAAERAIDLAEAQDFSVKVATIVGFKDAAEAAQADPANVRKIVESAVPAPEFYFKKYLPHDAKELSTREGIAKLRAILAKLKHIASPVEREYWMKELAKRTGINERTLVEEAEKTGGIEVNPKSQIPNPKFEAENSKKELTRQDRLVEELFAAALAKNDISILDDCIAYFTPPQNEIREIFVAGNRKSDDPALDEQIGLIVLRAARELTDVELVTLKAELAKQYYRERRRIITLAIRNAEANGNAEELAAAMKELGEIPGAGE